MEIKTSLFKLRSYSQIARSLLHKVHFLLINFSIAFKGIFDRVAVSLSLRRHVYYYLMEYYFPLVLVVATSWISFWIDYRCTAARATLPVTTFLTLTSIAETLRAKDAGSLSYSTVLEVYINVCTFYVFAALIEYAVIGAVDQILKKVCDVFISTVYFLLKLALIVT